MNTLDLTTLANVKSWLGIKGSDFDDDLARLITAVSLFAQNWMNRRIIQAEYVDQRDGHGGNTMMLSNQPVVSVSSVVVDGSQNPSNGYSTSKNGVYLNYGSFRRAKNNITITYVAGYANVPADIEQAIIETIALRWKERDRIGMSSKTLAGETTSFIIKDFPPSAQSILLQYKKVIPI